MKPRSTFFFNMVEIVLAIGVIAVGMVSIMALFPVGLSASRDAVGESYATDSADQFLHYMVGVLRASSSNWDAFADSSNSAFPTASEPTSWAAVYSGSNLYIEDDASPDEQFYKVIQKAPGTSAEDFSGIYRVWYSGITLNSTDIGTPIALGLNIEVSWPTELPYAQRERAQYYREVFNPNN